MIGLWIFGLFGIFLFVLGIFSFHEIKKKKIKCTSKTYGKVIDIIKRRGSTARGYFTWIFYPVFEYNIGENKFVKESLHGTSDLKYIIGQEVEVYYNTEDYNEYYIAGDTTQKTSSIFLTIIGGLAIILSIYIFIKIY